MNRYSVHESKRIANWCSQCGKPAPMTLCEDHINTDVIGDILSKPHEKAFKDLHQAFMSAADRYLNQTRPRNE